MREKLLGTFIITLFLAETMFILPPANFSEIQDYKDSVMPEHEFIPDDVNKLLSATPRAFTANHGQLENDEVRFYSQGGDVWFTDDGVWFELREEIPIKSRESRVGSRESDEWFDPMNNLKPPVPVEYKRVILKQEFVGANKLKPEGRERLSWNSNFFYGNDSAKWCPNVPNYREVFYKNLYDGIDLRYYTNEKGLKYDFIVHPGAAVEQIRLKYKGAEGMDVDIYGSLIIRTAIENVKDENLFIYQEHEGFRERINGRFEIINNLEYGFELLDKYDKKEPLVIDPQIKLNYSTFVGGSQGDHGFNLEIDMSGNAFVTGETGSSDFPTTPGANDTSYNSNPLNTADVFILKLNSNASNLIYSTYIGGSGFDRGLAIKIDSSGNSFITGWTSSSDFPTTVGAFDTSFNINFDCFILKLNQNGSYLNYSTFIDAETGIDIALDSLGNAFVTGMTQTLNFTTTPGAFDSSYNDETGVYGDCFVLKLNQNGSKLIYSTLIGGRSIDIGCGIALDSKGYAYVVGYTESSNFTTTPGANDTSYNGNGDIFILKLNQNGSSLIYSTYIGGKMKEHFWGDWGVGFTINSNGSALMIGNTDSLDFPTTPDAYDTIFNGSPTDIFVLKLEPNGSKINFSTFIGGNGYEYGSGITYDLIGNIYLTGITSSPDFPITQNAYDSTINGSDGFIIKLAWNGSTLLYSTFIGKDGRGYSCDIELDTMGNIYLTGYTGTQAFPTTPGAFNRTLSGNGDIFIAKFSFKPIFYIKSILLLKNDTPVDTLYAKYCQYNFQIKIVNTVSLSDFSTVILNLNPKGIDIQLYWDSKTGRFLKYNDNNNYITLTTSSKVHNYFYWWTIDFNLTFNWTYPEEDLQDAQVFATSTTLSPVWLNVSDFYRVENDLVFNGSLVVQDENNLTIQENNLIRGGEKLNWTGLTPVYESTTNIYPSEEEYDVTLWDENGISLLDSTSEGLPFYFETITSNNTEIDGYTYIINLTGIPPECDHTNTTFTIRIDGDNVSFSNPIPEDNIWQRLSEVRTGITITDIGGGLVDGATVMYCISNNSGVSWCDWRGIKNISSKKKLVIEKFIEFEDGDDNFIKWRANDSVGNGPVESGEYRVLVDTKGVFFSNPVPSPTEESTSERVKVGINISDNTSGVNASTIMYAVSTNSGKSWSYWKSVKDYSNNQIINIALNLTFPNGTANRIKWRAYDIAGNGPTESEAYIINVNIPLQELPPKVELLNPKNNSIISTSSVELSWRLVDQNLGVVTFDLYFDNSSSNIPSVTGISDMSLNIDNLSNDQTYYWTVIPRTTQINGTCESGVWSFTVNIPIPKVNLITPENNSVINDFQPRLSWGVEYDGTKILSYNVYFGASKDLELKFEKHPSTSCFIKERLTAGQTYYWKVEPWAGNIQGPASETWSFTVKQEYIPHFELELFVSPPVVELKPGDIKRVRAIVRNLGELEDSILLRVEVPPDLGVGAMVEEPSITNVVPNGTAEFYITVTTSMDPQKDEINLTVIASSRRATEYELTVEEKAELTVKILTQEKKDEDEPWLSLSEFWIIFLIIIIILIVLIIVWTFLRHKKSSQESKEESTAEDALTVKPGTVPEAVITVGKAPQTVTQPQLPETTGDTELGQQTQAIAKVPTLASSTAPGQVPETQQIPSIAEVPQLPAAQNQETESETSEESTVEASTTLTKQVEPQQETAQNSQEKD